MLRTPVGLAAAALLLVTACAPGSGAVPSATQAPAEIGAVTIRVFSNIGAFAGGFNMVVVGGSGYGPQVLYQFYDKLVTLGPDPKDPTKVAVLPYVATKWEQTARSITFTLRKDVTCADGTPLTATAVKKSYEYAFTSPFVFAQFGPGPFTFAADDAAGTFTWTSAVPFSDGIYGFAGDRIQPIICPAGVANPDRLKTAPVGSGPYTYVDSIGGDRITMKRRDDWKWGPNGITAKDLPKEVTFKNVQNDTTAANLLITGGLDIGAVAGPDVPRLLAERSLHSKSVTSTYNYTMIFNEKEGRPTADIKVREALISAVDVNAWNRAANFGRGEVSPSFLMPRADCFDPATANYRVKDPSPEKAKQILLAAGWTVGPSGKLVKDGKPLVILLIGTESTLGKGPEFLAAQWEKAGVTVDFRSVDYSTYVQQHLLKSDFDAFPTTYPFDQPNPGYAINRYTGPLKPKGTNDAYTVNPDAEAAIVAAYASVGAERCRQWSIVQQSLLKRWDILPLASPNVYWFSRGIDFFPGALSIDPRFFKPAKK